MEKGIGGNKFKGDYQLVAKNTAFDCFVAIPKGWGTTAAHNEHSLVRNNLADNLVEWNMRNRIEGITAKMDHNVSGKGSARRLLRDPDNFDFRPRADAKELIDAGMLVKREELLGKEIRLPQQPYQGSAPDIGAYEFGSEHYWIPGCTIPQASTPIPSDGAQTVKTDADLMWLRGREAVAHTVYFSDSAETIQTATITSKLCIVKALDTVQNIVDPGTQKCGQTYYWRVDVVDADGSVLTGKVWSFKVP